MGESTKRGSLGEQMTFSKCGWEKLAKVPFVLLPLGVCKAADRLSCSSTNYEKSS